MYLSALGIEDARLLVFGDDKVRDTVLLDSRVQ